MFRSLMKRSWLVWVILSMVIGSWAHAQKPPRRAPRAAPPKLQGEDFSGVYFPDPVAQLQGSPASKSELTMPDASESNADSTAATATGSDVWKQLISGGTIEDLVKEAKSRVDGVITTPAKFASGGFNECRREFTLLASLMAIISQYSEDIRWKASAPYARAVFAKLAKNCQVGTQQVYNDAKQRQQDLQDLMKGSRLNGSAEELVWRDVAQRKPIMQLLEWSLRKNLAPSTRSQDAFGKGKEDLVKYAELVAAFGHILQQEGMLDADSEDYIEISKEMVAASKDVVKAVKANDAELARTAVGRIDQSCSKCHESYKN